MRKNRNANAYNAIDTSLQFSMSLPFQLVVVQNILDIITYFFIVSLQSLVSNQITLFGLWRITDFVQRIMSMVRITLPVHNNGINR